MKKKTRKKIKYAVGTEDPVKPKRPYVQSNAMAASAQEDSFIGMLNDYKDLPDFQQTFVDDKLKQNDKPLINKTQIRDFLFGSLAILPDILEKRDKYQTAEPQEAYNPNPQGTGSQAIAKSGWIQKAINPAHKGYCTPMTKSTCTPRRKALAMRFKSGDLHKGEAGAIIEEYKAGGNLTSNKAREILKDGSVHGKKLTDKQKRYFGWIAGGRKAEEGMTTDPGDREKYYQSSARLSHYKGLLNEKLKAKNPKAYGDFFKGLVDIRKKGDTQGASKYIEDTPYNEYLSPDDVRSTLGDEDYKSYLESIRDVNTYNVAQGQRPLYGTKEDGTDDLSSLNYGRRFASLMVTPGMSISNEQQTKKYSRNYTYDPKTRLVDFKEEGDESLRPSYLSTRQSITKMKGGGKIKGKSSNYYDGGTIEFSGPSHAKGGVDISYGGEEIEVEGGETAFKDSEGNLNIMGNMLFPGTKKKFKTISKKIAKEEDKYSKIMSEGEGLARGSIKTKFDRIKASTGTVMLEGGNIGMQQVTKKKELLAAIQEEMLNIANEAGIDPIAMSEGKVKKAKYGAKIKAQAGHSQDPKPSVAQRHNNPGNIKYGDWAKKYGAVKGEKASDGGYFAKFPDVNTGMNALKGLLKSKNYRNLDVESAIKRWTNNKPYSIELGDLSGKKISSLDDKQFSKLVNVMTLGEDSKLYSGEGIPKTREIKASEVRRPKWISEINVQPPQVSQEKKQQYTSPQYEDTELDQLVYEDKKLPSAADFNKLTFSDISPELFSIIGSKVDPVPAQKFQPQLYEPYNVSFQDRLNENQSTFNANARTLAYNPAALGAAAAQKYAADNQVLADQFRTNQGIGNDIINKNINLLNTAQLKNLDIADQQMVRQSTARSKTRSQLFEAINSVQRKEAMNRLENVTLRTYEPLFDYRYSDANEDGIIDDFEYAGEDPKFNWGASQAAQEGEFTRTKEIYSGQGDLKQVQKTTPSGVTKQKELLQNEALRQRVLNDFMNTWPVRTKKGK